MRAARFLVSTSYLNELMHMPAMSQIVGAEMSDDDRSVILTVEDPSLPEHDEPHDVVPTVTKESYRWDWQATP